jgi:hypothetical protein
VSREANGPALAQRLSGVHQYFQHGRAAAIHPSVTAMPGIIKLDAAFKEELRADETFDS